MLCLRSMLPDLKNRQTGIKVVFVVFVLINLYDVLTHSPHRYFCKSGFRHVLENLENYGCPGKVQEKRIFQIVLEQWHSHSNVLEKFWNSFGRWNLFFYGSLSVTSLLLFFMFYAIYSTKASLGSNFVDKIFFF